MMALSKIFYRNVKKGNITLEEITIDTVRKEVEELLRLDIEKE